MHRGYTKRWRKRWDKDYCKDSLMFTMMEYFIDHANYKDTEIFFPNVGTIPLKRGEHIFSTVKLSVKLGVGRQRIRSKLKILKNIGFLTIKSTSLYTKVFIINYNVYQPNEKELNQASNQRLTSAQPALNQRLTIDKKDKNIKKVNKEEVTFFSKSIPQKIESLKYHSIFKDADIFYNFQISQQMDENLIEQAFNQIYKKSKNGNELFRQWKGKDAWAYCEKIVSAENGITNARQSEKESESHKQGLNEIFEK